MFSDNFRSQSSGTDSKKKSETEETDSTVCMTIFIFRGEPDVYYKRHVLIYFESPENQHFHETLHAQRDNENSPWFIDNPHNVTQWVLSNHYINHVYIPEVMVIAGRENDVVNLAKSIPIGDKEQDDGWNCQTFVYEALSALVEGGYLTPEGYDQVENELMTKLLEGAVG